jgi:acetyl-CoA carboxylase carboxyltransferase component
MGSCGGGAAYGPGLTDFIIMTKGTSRMFMGGPAFVQSMLAEVKTADQLGGPHVHSEITGLCDLLADSDEHALELTKELLAFLPSTNRQRPRQTETKDRPERRNEGILEILPVSTKRGYDMHHIISAIVDDGYFFRLKPDYARNMITGFARLNGRPVGILANQPGVKGGVIDVHAAGKHARFVQLCDCFNIPLLYLQDSPGVLIGQEEEYRGIIKIGSKMLHANTQATVPKISLIIRHAYAAAPSCMCSKAMGADFVFAWPTAELALVGAEAAASLLNAKEIAAAADPEQLRQERIGEYEELWANPYRAAERGYVDDVIHPEDTRRVLIDALESVIEKKEERPWKKHGNIQM